MIGFSFLFLFLLWGSVAKASKGWTIVILFLFSILIGFRDGEVGTDTMAYASLYEDIGMNGYTGYPEPLFGYLNFWCYKLGLDFSVFQWGLALGMMFLIGKVVFDHSPNYGYSVFVLYALYFIFYTMNITRQMFAVSILFYGYAQLYKGYKWRFLISVVLATLCHFISIVSLIILFVDKIKLKSVFWVLISVLFSCVVGLVVSDSFFITIAGDYAGYLVNSFSSGFRDENRILLSMLLAIGWSGLFTFIYIYIDRNLRNNFWFKIYYIAVIINNLTLRMELGLRVVLLFSIVEILVFPMFLLQNRMKQRFLPIVLVNMALAIFFFIFLWNNSAGILPYRNLL